MLILARLKFLAQRSIYLPFLAGVLFSVFANYLGWDLAVQFYFYDPATAEWSGRQNTLMVGLYQYSVLPALILGLIGLFGYLGGILFRKLRPWRKIYLYLFAVLIVGNGILANALFKSFWGRPRPAQVNEFGGTQNFEPCLWIDLASYGKSFPCGHATMGFYFFALALLLKGLARQLCIAFAIGFGALIGLSRLSYGGHFLTDVVWAAILMWLVALGLYHLLEIPKQWRYEERPPRSKGEARRQRWVRLVLMPLVFVVLGLAATRSPRDKTDSLSLATATPTMVLKLDLRGTVKFQSSSITSELIFKTRGQGFGFPKTKLHLKSEALANGTRVYHNVSGFFSDLEAVTLVHLPTGHQYEFHFATDTLKDILLNGEALDLLPVLKIDLREQP